MRDMMKFWAAAAAFAALAAVYVFTGFLLVGVPAAVDAVVAAVIGWGTWCLIINDRKVLAAACCGERAAETAAMWSVVWMCSPPGALIAGWRWTRRRCGAAHA